jgi:hypothetical protein
MEVLAEVFDLNGKLIATRFHYLPEQDAVIIIPIQGPSAAYILRVHTPNAVIRKPLIKH